MKFSAGTFVLTLALAAATASAQQQVHRCEGKDGKVTYSNTQCPEGTTPVRKVNTDPPMRVEDQQAAKDRAKKDAAEVKQIEKERAQQDAREQRTATEQQKNDAKEQKKAEAKTQEKCDKARRDLEKAKATRAELYAQATTVERMQKADREISRREADVARDCPR
jgi:TolA-binding protein